MQNVDNARADAPTVAQISRANDPETNGEVTEDGEIESWLSALRPPSTSDTEPVQSTDGDDPAAPHAIPTRLPADNASNPSVGWGCRWCPCAASWFGRVR
jgi:hypothetical protein